MPPQRARYFLAFIWTFTFVITCPVLAWNRWLEGESNRRIYYPKHYYGIMATVAIAILVTTALYARLLAVAWRHRHAIRALELPSVAGSSSGYLAAAKRESRLTKTGCMIIGMLYFSWLPYIIGNVFLGDKKDMFSSVLRQMIFTTLTANSMINPFLYQWRIPEFHTAFRKLMPCMYTYNLPFEST